MSEGVDARGTVVTSDGTVIAYSLAGPSEAPKLMLIHSLGTDSRLWDHQMDSLLLRYRVLRYDSRGHGQSGAPSGNYTLARLGLDALEVMNTLGIDMTMVCGISLGGMVGQWLGAQASAKISKLALCNTSAYMGPPVDWDLRISNVRSGGMAAVADAVLKRWFTPEFLVTSPRIVEFARSMLLETSPTGYAGCCAAIRDMDLRSLGSRIPQPTLIIAGAHDLAAPPTASQALLAQIPRARLAYLPAAHLSNLEQPAVFIAALIDFLNDATE